VAIVHPYNEYVVRGQALAAGEGCAEDATGCTQPVEMSRKCEVRLRGLCNPAVCWLPHRDGRVGNPWAMARLRQRLASTLQRRQCSFAGEKLEAAIGVEPMMEVLQSSLAENRPFCDLL